VDNVSSQGFNVSLAVHYFVINLLWQKCCSKNQSNFSTRERFSTLCHTLQCCKCSTPIRCNECQCLLCACGQFQYLACTVLAEASIYKIAWKSRLFLNFSWVVYVVLSLACCRCSQYNFVLSCALLFCWHLNDFSVQLWMLSFLFNSV
jgi:hypothetical protein